ncbi:MAG: CoA transferase [Alcaligenaceae bacterium]|nr:MAG: CoA transferase [Alcaligenaceae bacterium]
MSNASFSPLPLIGVRIISMAEQYPGPLATKLLAELGADVVLVERPGKGDPARAYPGFFESLSRGKRSVCLDLKEPQDREVMQRLLAEADAFLEGFRPGVMDRLGFGPAAVKELNKRITYVSISGYGQTGPYAARSGHDLSYAGMAGALSDSNAARDLPAELALGDIAAATHAAIAVLSGILAARSRGYGAYVDVSITESLLGWLGPAVLGALNNQERFSTKDEPAYGCFSCKDGVKLTLSIAHEDHFWKELCEVLGLPDIGELDANARHRDCAVLSQLIASRIGSEQSAHWEQRLSLTAVPWAPVLEFADMPLNPHLRERGQLRPRPDKPGTWDLASALVIDGFRPTLGQSAPRLGEHTQAALKGDIW